MLFCHYDALHTIFVFPLSLRFSGHTHPPPQVGTKKYVVRPREGGLDRVHAVRSFSGLGPVLPTNVYERGRA